jgi:hypothetical protein
MWLKVFGGIAPAQNVAIYENNAAQNPAVDNT